MTTPKIIATEKGPDGNSYRIKFNKNMTLWFDTWHDESGEFTGDWNKYIFYTTDEQDMKEKAFQENCDNFETALELCDSEYLKDVHVRLEYLRGEIEKECISYGEIAELQGLVKYIEEGDVVLLEWAGVPEHTE